MTGSELREMLGKHYNYYDRLIRYYREEMLKGNLDVLTLNEIMVKFPEFINTLPKEDEDGTKYGDYLDSLVFNFPFVIYDYDARRLHGEVVNPKIDLVELSDDGDTILIKRKGSLEWENFDLTYVSIIPFISMYGAMGGLSLLINNTNKVKLDLGYNVMDVVSVSFTLDMVVSGSMVANDTYHKRVRFNIMDVISVTVV